MTATVARSGTVSRARAPDRRVIGLWLALCCAMIFAMVLIGGATRLTESGLSIAYWHPITGWLPPLDTADWQAAFNAYQRTPEFQKVNSWMSLADFKAIFWLEYVHRLWGRLIGVAFLLPFLWFAVRGRIDGRLGWKLAGLFVLGGLQGALGWYMVASGLVSRPDVSHYRLAAHLSLAVAIYASMLWIALGCLRPRAAAALHRPLVGHNLLLLGWIAFTMVVGAFVAGLNAGFIYNTFPLMAGYVVPPVAFGMQPWWINFLDNPVLVQFVHRVVAITLVVIAIAFWLRARRRALPRPARIATAAVALAALGQMCLGIATLLAAVPVPLGVAHQGGALVVFSLTLWALYELSTAPAAGPARQTQPGRG